MEMVFISFPVFLANKMWKGTSKRIGLDWGQSFSLARYDTNANIGFEINPNIAKNPTIALIWTFVSNCIMSSIDFDFWPRRWPSTLALANTLVNWPWNLPWRKKKFSNFSPFKKAWNYCRCMRKKIGVANVWKIIAVRHHHYHHQCLSLALALHNLIAMLYFSVLWMLKYRW